MGSALSVSAAELRGLFDAEYYAEQNEDVVAVYGTDADALYEHYTTYGINEGRFPSKMINVKSYRSKYADLEKAFGDDWAAYVKHYLEYGLSEGRDGGGEFDAASYADRYQDLYETFGYDLVALYDHYLTFGINENRNTISQDIVEEREAAEAAARAEEDAENESEHGDSGSEGTDDIVNPDDNVNNDTEQDTYSPENDQKLQSAIANLGALEIAWNVYVTSNLENLEQNIYSFNWIYDVYTGSVAKLSDEALVYLEVEKADAIERAGIDFIKPIESEESSDSDESTEVTVISISELGVIKYSDGTYWAMEELQGTFNMYTIGERIAYNQIYQIVNDPDVNMYEMDEDEFHEFMMGLESTGKTMDELYPDIPKDELNLNDLILESDPDWLY